MRSILGRYLEHSRIYRFAHGNVVHGQRLAGVSSDAVYLIGSADLMPRNLSGRVEVMVPIEHPRHTMALDQALAFALDDGVVRWELQPDDTWLRCGPTDAFEPHSQEQLYRWTVAQQAISRS